MVPILLLCLMLFLWKCNRRKIILSCFLWISVVVCLLPIFYFNNKLYSNILWPWNLEWKSILNIYQGPKDTKKDNNKYSITNLSTLKIKLWDINPIIILFFLLGFLSAYSRADHKYRKIYLLFLWIIFLQFVFYWSQTWSGINLKNTIWDSFSRYVLSSIVIVILFASFYFDYIRSKPIRIVSLFSLFLISFSIFLKGDFSFNDFNNQIIKSNIYKEMLGPRDVIFTSLRDKLLYPVGNFAIYTALPPEYRIEIVIKEIKRLLSAWYGVYFSKDSPAELDYTNDNYLDAFTSSGLKYSIITGDRTNFYKIEYKSHE